MKNIRIFYLKIFIFWVVKFSVYLNRHVFEMVSAADVDKKTETIHMESQKKGKRKVQGVPQSQTAALPRH